VYFERPTGPGNPQASPRPRPITDDIPPYLRERMQNDWNRYYHEQQIFYTDQPVSALVVGEDLLLTAASNLHGDPKRGRVLTDGGPVDCTIVAVHRPLDLALLRTSQPLPFPIAHFSERNDLACGDPIAVIGRHRASVAATCTTGVVSATQRRVNQGEFVLHQTDAMANYGSLGGAVIDRFGDVAGMVVFLGPQGERPWHINSGVAPFIDATSIQRALPGLIAGTSVARPRIIGLGVELIKDNSDTLRIGKVLPQTAAADAGLQAGDVLRAIDGEIMRSVEDVTRTLIRHRAGDTVQLRVDRNGEEVRIGVTLRAFTGDEEEP
jgi:S1-C subfamily serine protease